MNEDSGYMFSLDIARSWPQLAAFLEATRAGVDPGAGRRELIVERSFEQLDGRAGARIAADLLDGLRAERGLAGHRSTEQRS